MAKFKLIISDSETGKSKSVEVEGPKAQPLIGRKIGEVVDGYLVGLSGYELLITGGSDKDGTPMRPDVHGGARVSIILSKGKGFHASRRGERKRRLIRGNTITENIVQVCMKIVKKPKGK